MTLRQGLGADVQRIYEQIDDLLDSEDAIIILADGHRAIHYARGFGLSGATTSCWVCKRSAPYVG